ncbi:TlpA disulfide reductase family protein [Pedobacter sp. L105]|uniref:TlpA disulfide reductase family protein n=1 Tax=Pedobacter sp. L105 TaxID=1641871 RepID=UPI001C20615E|nr:TlpA disulfide reductase family protein [Pedobacter sp. L105]
MKKLYFFILCLIPISLMAQGDFTLDGKVGGLKNGDKIYMFSQPDGQKRIDSANVLNGSFHFSGNLPHPEYATIVLNVNPLVNKTATNLDVFHFYIEAGKIGLTAPDSLKHITITGSPINKENIEFNALRKPADDKLAALNKAYAMLPDSQKNEKHIADMAALELQYMDELHLAGVEFAKTHPQSYLSLIALKDGAAQAKTTQAVAKAFDNLNPSLKNTPLGKSITVLLTSSSKTRIGSQAIDFAQVTPDGKTVRLSDFKGKYVLIDFWASWCGPCREENPNIVAAYNKYKGKGFTILGVSLDNPGAKKSWIKAIADDQLIWTQVSDLKGWDNSVALQYGVRGIPANFLIDPNGKIIAKDLRRETLNAKLAELFDGPAK